MGRHRWSRYHRAAQQAGEPVTVPEIGIIILVVLPMLAIWLFVLVDAIRRPDLTAGRKIFWVLAALLVPLVAILVYLIARPRRSSGAGTEVTPAGAGCRRPRAEAPAREAPGERPVSPEQAPPRNMPRWPVRQTERTPIVGRRAVGLATQPRSASPHCSGGRAGSSSSGSCGSVATSWTSSPSTPVRRRCRS